MPIHWTTTEPEKHTDHVDSHVEHYLALWEYRPTPDNWSRVIEAAEAYPIEGFVTFPSSAGPGASAAASNARLGRRAAGRLFVYRKGARSWREIRRSSSYGATRLELVAHLRRHGLEVR